MNSQYKNLKYSSVFGLVLAGLLSAQSAHATFVMTLDDPNDNQAAIRIADPVFSMFGSGPGTFAYSGVVGDFNVNLIAGIASSVDGRRVLSLNSLNATSSSAGSLVVKITDWFNSGNFSMGNGSFAASTTVSGTTQGSVKFNALEDALNLVSGTLSSSFNQATVNYLPYVPYRDSTAPFEIAFLAEITHGLGSNTTNFSASISPSPVPLPAGIWLFMSALGGFSFIHRRNLAKVKN